MADPVSLRDAYEDAIGRLSRNGSPTPDLDATLLLEHATGLTALDRLIGPEKVLDHRQQQVFAAAIARRMNHEPVHRIMGWREFYGLPLTLNADTLVPRPDTETLVDLVVPFAREAVRRAGRCRVLDLGTGSGAIALAILHEAPKATAVGTDVSQSALDMAAQNAQTLDLSGRFEAVQSDWFSCVSGAFDLIVSNPPYIPSADIAHLDPDVRDHDPLAALDGGTDGLNAYGMIAAHAGPFLAPGGRLAVEIGQGQKAAVKGLFAAAGLEMVESARDLASIDRALMFAM